MSKEDALKELDDYLDTIGPCMDGYCVIKKPKGIHTNGGCRCTTNHIKMQRFAYAHNRFVEQIKSLSV